jgi:folate-binding protein YgfZ
MTVSKINKGLLSIKACNVRDILQGIITQDINALTPFSPIHTLFLNAGGRVMYCSIIYMFDKNHIVLEIAKDKLLDLAKHIYSFDLNKDLELADVSAEYTLVISDKKQKGLSLDPRCEKLPYRGIIADVSISSDLKMLERYEQVRLENCVFEDYDFIPGRTLANELNAYKLNAISLDKGCYLGQELTSRTTHIHKVKKQLVCLSNTFKNVENGKEIEIGNNQKAYLFSHNKQFVLAIIRK